MPPLPTSLSPHVCIQSSPDLEDLLTASSLPPLPQILQSFSPLPQVTTRTTSLTPVPHTSFTLRFSDLAEIEAGCREDEEERAVRTIDWISARISNRCAKWVEDMEKASEKDFIRTPWWDELRRCTESDHVPSKVEGWNHPAAVILAVSTMTPNPLQVLATLHARALDFPSWVDPAILRYTLIVHPRNSNLSDEEAGALFNAVKKQYGLHSYLLSLTLPSPPPPPIPVPTPLPRLPPPPSPDTPELTTERSNSIIGSESTPNTLRLGEKDIQMTARFTREFVVMSLIPWMEKCVVEWNENLSSSRRLPSRLFSSTRRLFGSPSPSVNPVQSSVPSSAPVRPNIQNNAPNSVGGITNSLPQQRRLAEFATILGDFKLAANVWESIRKEGKGGSDILPFLLTPAPTIQLHVSTALSHIHSSPSDPPAHAQLRAVLYAVRWEIGIAPKDFSDSILEGEKWLVWAAGKAEEPPSALLLAHAALLSARKQARRKATLWYFFAANQLEKCGIKPLTMYFLRRAHELYKSRPEKSLSPSFWESEGLAATDHEGFDAVTSSIEHPLGRLLYTTGEVAGAVRLFLGLLRCSSLQSPRPFPSHVTNGDELPSPDKIFLEDFRVAFKHFQAISKNPAPLSDLELPFTFCLTRQTRLRLPRDTADGEPSVWEKREEDWQAFWKSRGKEVLQKSGKGAVDERFWVDLVLRNPLDTEVNLSNLTIVVEEPNGTYTGPIDAFVEVESIDDVVLGARETRTIPVPIKSRRPASLIMSQVTYNFLSLLPATESLASRGQRLHGTSLQRQTAVYAPAVEIRVEVEEASHKLVANFVDDRRLVLVQGEDAHMRVWLSNAGIAAIAELWMVAGQEDQIWVAVGDDTKYGSASPSEVFHSPNSLNPSTPYHIDLTRIHGTPSLSPGESVEFSVVLHADKLEEQELCLLFVYREKEGKRFHTVQVTRRFEIKPIFEVSASVRPTNASDNFFVINLELNNVTASSAVELTQVTTLSPSWKCTLLQEHNLGLVAPQQFVRLSCGVTLWDDRSGSEETAAFVSRKLRDVLHGRVAEHSSPPPIDLVCSHLSKRVHIRSIRESCTRHFIHCGRRNIVVHAVAKSHPHIPVTSHPYIFPLYNPSAIDIVVFWEIPSQLRSGHLLVSNLILGAGHGALRDIIKEAEGLKVNRGIYAETRREKIKLFDGIRSSEWNVDMNPIVVTVQDVTLKHDFSGGSFHTSIPFTLRNYSLTHASRFVLKFVPYPNSKLPLGFLGPRYSGRLTFRGTLQPLGAVTLQPMVWITHPGTYSLGGWLLETEVGETSSSPTMDGDGNDAWRTRSRYSQRSPTGDASCITVCNVEGGYGI